jgi:hypothetical protein
MKSRRSFCIYVIVLCSIHFLINVQGLSWGLPAFWHPDESLSKIYAALVNHYIPYNTPNYPNLYLFFLYVCAGIAHTFCAYNTVFWILRATSLAFGSFGIAAVVMLARATGCSRNWSLFAGILLLSCNGYAEISHFAHNDIFVVVFTILGAYFFQRYLAAKNTSTMAMAFLFCGIATGCKYNGILMLPIMIPMVILVEIDRSDAWKKILGGIVLFFIPVLLSIPTALFSFRYYFSYIYSNFVLGYLSRHQGWGAGNPLGLIGQWSVIIEAVGFPLFALFAGTLLYFGILAVLKMIAENFFINLRRNALLICILLYAASFDFPLIVSRVYVARYIIPAVPFLIVASSLALQRAYNHFSGQRMWFIGKYMWAAMVLGIISLSMMRIASLNLDFAFDARYPAAAYLQNLPPDSTVEYLLYPPSMPSQLKAQKYPLQFRLFPSDPVRTGMNIGCGGLFKRAPEYFVWDSFTDNWVCSTPDLEQLHYSECDCWKQVLSGRTGYKMSKEFSYELPWYLPKVRGAFVNPEIKIFRNSKL